MASGSDSKLLSEEEIKSKLIVTKFKCELNQKQAFSQFHEDKIKEMENKFKNTFVSGKVDDEESFDAKEKQTLTLLKRQTKSFICK